MEQGRETVVDDGVEVVDSTDPPRSYDHHTNDTAAWSACPVRFIYLKKVLRSPLPGGERGASSGEFVFAVLVLAAAIVLGGLGGVWIAKREGVQKPKATESTRVAEQPSIQPAKPPENDKVAETPAKAQPPKAPEIKPRTGKPAVKSTSPQLPSIEAISYSSQAGTTQVTIESGAASLARAAGLPNPERVYFDLQVGQHAQGARGRLDTKKEMTVSDDPLLAGIRVARWTSGNIRVVLDLRRPCDFSYQISPQPASRIIVELKARPAGGSAPNAPEIRKDN